MLQKVLVFALLQVFVFSKQCKSQNPPPTDIAGLTAKVNQRGVDFVTEQINTFAENFLSASIFPDFNISFTYWFIANIRNVSIINLDLGEVRLMTTPPNKVMIELGKTSFKLNGSLSITNFISLGSHFLTDIDDYQVKVRAALGRHRLTNTLTVALTSCDATIGGLSLNFSGDPTQVALIELAVKYLQLVIGNDIAKFVETSICPWMHNFIPKTVYTLLSNYTKTFDLPLNTTVDLSLTQDPVATSSSLQLFANGTCFPTEDPNFEVQLDSLTLPTLQDSTKMFQGAISQNVLNTYIQSVFSQGYLDFTYEVEKVLSLINSFLPNNVQYDVVNVVGRCIDTSAMIDTRKPLTFEFLTGSAPRIAINDKSFSIFVEYQTLLRYHTLFATGPSDVIALDATYKIFGNVYGTENEIGWNFYCVKIDVSKTCFSNNAVQEIKNNGVSIVNMLLNSLRPMGTFENLNHLTLPIILGYSPDNVEVILKEGALEFAGDIALAE